MLLRELPMLRPRIGRPITQIRQNTPGRELYRRKMAEGKTHEEPLRVLKRRISDAVWRQLHIDRSDDQTQDTKWPRWPSSRGNLVADRSLHTPRYSGRPMQPKTVRSNLDGGFGVWPHRSISTG